MPERVRGTTLVTAIPVRRRVTVDFSNSPSMTKQSFKDQCDINNILERFNRDGMVTHLNSRAPFYGDVSLESASDYRAALDLVDRAERGFMDLSSDVRARFGNDPAKLLEFMADPKNLNEAVSLGLVKKVSEAPAAPPVVKPA